MCLCIDVSLVKKRIQNIYKRPSNFYKIVYPNITSKLQKRFFATFLPIICPVKVEAFKYIWGSTARFLCFFQESFSLPLKNYSFQWHEILDTNLDNLISDIGHIDSIESHEKFTFYFAKKNPDMKSSLFWSGYLNTLISYSKSWYQYQNKNIFFTWTLEPC